MKSFGIVIICVMACLASSPSLAQETRDGAALQQSLRQVMGNELLPTFENKTMEGIYNSYESDSRAGIRPETYTETHFDNATTLYDHRGNEKSYTIRGIYQIKKDQVCYTYQSEAMSGNYCFYVFTRDGCYYHYYEPMGFPKSPDEFANWASMAYAKEDEQTCLPNIA